MIQICFLFLCYSIAGQKGVTRIALECNGFEIAKLLS